MIRNFRHKGLQELYENGSTRRLGQTYIRKCVRILQSLEVASVPEDMNVAGYHFHPLQGKPARWSVRVTANYRVTFAWAGEEAIDIDLEDDH